MRVDEKVANDPYSYLVMTVHNGETRIERAHRCHTSTAAAWLKHLKGRSRLRWLKKALSVGLAYDIDSPYTGAGGLSPTLMPDEAAWLFELYNYGRLGLDVDIELRHTPLEGQ